LTRRFLAALIKIYRIGRKRHAIFVAEFHRGVMIGLTFIESKAACYLQNMRKGFLRYAKLQ